MITRKSSAISNAAAAALVIVIIIVAGGAAYYFVSTSQPTTVTSISTKTTISTSISTSATTQVSSTTLTTSSTGPNLNVDPHPDQFVYETIGQPQFLDPSIDYETAGAEIIQNVYEQLMFFKGADATTVVPWLASSQTVSTDGLTYTYVLRPGLTFTDGTSLNATAVYYSVMRALLIDDPDGPSWALAQILRGGANYSVGYNGDGAYTQAEVDALVAAQPITVDNNLQVSFHLERPYAAFPYIMAFSVTAVVDPTVYTKNWTPPTSGVGYITGITAGDYADEANPWAITNMVGSGPYALTSWDQATQTIVLQANPSYWGGPDGSVHPTIQTIVIKGIDDSNTRELDLKAGTADLSLGFVATGQVFDFVDQNTWFSSHTITNIYPGVSVFGPFPTFETDFLGFNLQIKDASGHLQAFQPFADLRVREAISLLWDDAAYTSQVLKDFSPAATQIIPPGMFGYNASITTPPVDVDKATALLVDAGSNPMNANNSFSPSNPHTVSLGFNTGNNARETAATLMAAAINSISSTTGLSATVQPLPWPQYLAARANHQLQLYYLGWVVDYVDPDDFLVPFANGFFSARVGYFNATVADWVAQQAVTLDPTARLAIIQNIQVAINNAHIYIWLNNAASLFYIHSWVAEKPNAFITSNTFTTANTALYGPYYAEIQALTG